MIKAIKMLYGTIAFLSLDSNFLGIDDSISKNSIYYGNLITTQKEQKETRTKRILQNEENKTRIINTLEKTANQIQYYDFNRLRYQNRIINPNDSNDTYGKNQNNSVFFSWLFLSDDLSDDDRAFAVIHEFAHFVLYKSNVNDSEGRSMEIYIDDLFDIDGNKDKYSDDNLIERSPDFYVFLCASCY